jgi:putative transposase
MTERSSSRYFRTSPEIIRLAVMLYLQFLLLLRNVEDFANAGER